MEYRLAFVAFAVLLFDFGCFAAVLRYFEFADFFELSSKREKEHLSNRQSI